ncbi:HAD-IC family P-type ATPase [Haliea sp. E1-2-M8]|uniref:cation-translocating P-type ATPase n=1 Tax=Haliea sp. E1-2-M8 TaxID=3064706 RepID=UPI0027206087|nr:HAD-IC family P-type ATPase [Haliea sp. E1-2-M8]MDO8862314.1 HAD-IC family P-type ATPase [Haliea sp. E1-2-M8]
MTDSDRSWHALPVEEVFGVLHATSAGLSAVEAARRLQESGPNLIPRTTSRPWYRILLHQLADPIVYVLIVAALLAFVMGKVADSLVVSAVVLLNTIIGFVQEMRASKAIEALSVMVSQNATVLREGESILVPSGDIVPGDVILLQPGDKVAADVRLFEVNGLQLDEAVLTGESVPVGKQEAPTESNAIVGDRLSMAFGGTLVTAGTADGIVVATGASSELGQISRLLSETVELETPLTRRIARLARAITVAITSVAGLIFLVGMWRENSLLDSALAAITLAVAAIPEGLPAVITIASAIGVQRMARRRVIIRHLPAVETLGSTTVICTDKTGTLTRNEMTVEALWTPTLEIEVTGIGYTPEGQLRVAGQDLDPLPDDVRELLVAGALCNDSNLVCTDGHWSIVGDPTEGALAIAALKAGLEESVLQETFPRRGEIPFSSERQFMATLHDGDSGNPVVYLKGAPEVIARMCTHFADGQLVSADLVHEAAHTLAARGMRVLALARGTLKPGNSDLQVAIEQRDLCFLGIAGMTDPPREEAIESVRACQRAGIVVKMVTGDHAATAGAIGREIGLFASADAEAGVVTGQQIHDSSDDELISLVRTTNVFARVAPEHKLRLVKALQADGQVVAMTGDGVNDAPALKRAEIGVAMGINGTAVAREAADMVLADDNFASISAAVEEGRRVYDNLAKSLAFVLPTSLGQALIILVAVLFFPVTDGHLLMPIEPVQILWVNLVVAIALALPLAFEAREPGLMDRAPRPPNEPLLSPFLVFRTVLVGVLMTLGAIALFLREYHADLLAGVPTELARAEAQTLAVTTIILFQMLYLLNCRSLTQPLWRIGPFSNSWVYVGIGSTLGLQFAFVYLEPLNRLFHSSPMDGVDWFQSGAVALAGFIIISLEKWYWRRKQANTAIRSGARADCQSPRV